MKSGWWLIGSCLFICLYAIVADPGLLGVSREGQKGSDLTGASFELKKQFPGSSLSRLTGEGLHLALNQFEIRTSRGVLNITQDGFEFRRGRATWITTRTEDRMEIRRNNDMVLTISSSDRLPRPQFNFAGQGIFYDVLIDKSENAKSLANFCLVERVLSSISGSSSSDSSRTDHNYCRESTATSHYTLTQHIEHISRLLVSLSEYSSRLSKSTSQEKALESTITNKIQPLSSRMAEVESKISSELDKQKSSTANKMEEIKKLWQDDLARMRRELQENSRRLQESNDAISLDRESIFQQFNTSHNEMKTTMDTLVNDVSSSLAKANALFARLLVETNQTLSSRIENQFVLFKDAIVQTRQDLQSAMDTRETSVVNSLTTNLSRAVHSLEETFLQKVSDNRVQFSRSLTDVISRVDKEHDHANRSITELEGFVKRSLTESEDTNKRIIENVNVAVKDLQQAHKSVTDQIKMDMATQEKDASEHNKELEKRIIGLRENMDSLSEDQKSFEKSVLSSFRAEMDKESDNIRQSAEALKSRVAVAESGLSALRESVRLQELGSQGLFQEVAKLSVVLEERDKEARQVSSDVKELRNKFPEVVNELAALRVHTHTAVESTRRLSDTVQNFTSELVTSRLTTTHFMQDFAKDKLLLEKNVADVSAKIIDGEKKIKNDLDQETSRAKGVESDLSKRLMDMEIALRVSSEREKDRATELLKAHNDISELRASQQRDILALQTMVTTLLQRVNDVEKDNIHLRTELEKEKQLNEWKRKELNSKHE